MGSKNANADPPANPTNLAKLVADIYGEIGEVKGEIGNLKGEMGKLKGKLSILTYLLLALILAIIGGNLATLILH